MQEIIFGVLLLFGLVGIQAGMRYWTVHRTRRSWHLAQEHMSRGDFGEAEQALARCIKLMPLWTQARMLYGAVLAQQGKLDDAEENLRMAAELEPKQADGHIELGIFYVTAAGRIDEGLAAFRQALACDERARYRIDTEPRLRDFRESDAYAQLEA